MFRSHVMVCGGTGCTSSGSDRIAEAFEKEIAACGLENEVKVVRTGCFGLCALGPIVVIYPEASFYSMVKAEDVAEIVSEHLLKGRPVTRLLYDETVAAGAYVLLDHLRVDDAAVAQGDPVLLLVEVGVDQGLHAGGGHGLLIQQAGDHAAF